MEKDETYSQSLKTFDIDALLHPACAFTHPESVLRDPDLTINEKRAILASWASDACAVDSAPAFRQAPIGNSIGFDQVMEALRALDAEAAKARVKPQNPFKRRFSHWKFNRRSVGLLGGVQQ